MLLPTEEQDHTPVTKMALSHKVIINYFWLDNMLGRVADAHSLTPMQSIMTL